MTNWVPHNERSKFAATLAGESIFPELNRHDIRGLNLRNSRFIFRSRIFESPKRLYIVFIRLEVHILRFRYCFDFVGTRLVRIRSQSSGKTSSCDEQ